MSLLVSVHDLMNRPGQMREVEFDHVLDEAIGTDVVAVPAGAITEISLRLESVHEGVLVTGEVFATAETQCSRCLDSMSLEVEVDFQELFAYSSQSDEDLEVINEHVDLEQVL
ncbi:MAG: DUF177 domain-containing protein, partial [Micrococcales bacterium]|nr:DUF177 domain-containing protein [Micrococcales bacterium]